jgi:hypothetical protein
MAKTLTNAEARHGMKLVNNDPRCPEVRKVVSVIAADETHVYYKAGTRTAKIAFHRIFTDGQARHQGYNTVGPVAVQTGIAG